MLRNSNNLPSEYLLAAEELHDLLTQGKIDVAAIPYNIIKLYKNYQRLFDQIKLNLAQQSTEIKNKKYELREKSNDEIRNSDETEALRISHSYGKEIDNLRASKDEKIKPINRMIKMIDSLNADEIKVDECSENLKGIDTEEKVIVVKYLQFVKEYDEYVSQLEKFLLELKRRASAIKCVLDGDFVMPVTRASTVFASLFKRKPEPEPELGPLKIIHQISQALLEVVEKDNDPIRLFDIYNVVINILVSDYDKISGPKVAENLLKQTLEKVKFLQYPSDKKVRPQTLAVKDDQDKKTYRSPSMTRHMQDDARKQQANHLKM
ncbi:MAG TPA: hypothetical protein VL360_01025 [Gammaproteobacteria bacterium]|jgi:hypothetical protein|nr:hypothetical protein [Gammaproteobacteria bacterium]